MLSIYLTLPCQQKQTENTHIGSKAGPRLWDESNTDTFLNNIDVGNIHIIEEALDTMRTTTNAITTEDLNSIVVQISNLFTNAAQKSFKTSRAYLQKSNLDKLWFGTECKNARDAYHKAKSSHQKSPSVMNKQELQNKSRKYKRTMNKHIRKHKFQTKQKLRKLNKHKPKEFWKIINNLEKKSEDASLPINQFYEYFKELNALPDTHENIEPNINIHDNDEIINSPITREEITKCAKQLKNNKAFGNDNILNEHIKTTLALMLPIYEKLFNLVFDSGSIPCSWVEGVIRPIYKRSGDKHNPDNYRPISILSCLGKLFTSILNSRLTKFLEENDILEENQAGFREGYSTSSHIFVVHALIELMKSRKRKLFCCFIDFSKAFDSVWRAGLWQKLLKSGIDGKLFRTINSMYQNIKSCVRVNGIHSPFFASLCGVRQGENLSPLLFALYLNDLELYLTENGCEGISVQYSDDDIFTYFKILVLLYADDTVLFAETETVLQNNLNIFKAYCDTWKLNINYKKTKIMIFGIRNVKKFNFYIDGNLLEIVDNFKYLGVYFSKSRSFLKSRTHATEQARKALHLLYKRIRKFNLPIDLQLKLFDHTILPILIYGCEKAPQSICCMAN